MKLYDIIKMYGFDPREFRFVRHGPKEISPLEVFQDDPEFFNSYQSLQRKGKFRNAQYIASFAPYHGTQGLFLGVWKIDNEAPADTAPESHLELIEHFGWHIERMTYYKLSQVETFNDLSERLVIEWGRAAVAWVQKKDKEVLAILQPSQIQEFQSYEQTVIMRSLVNCYRSRFRRDVTLFDAI